MGGAVPQVRRLLCWTWMRTFGLRRRTGATWFGGAHHKCCPPDKKQHIPVGRPSHSLRASRVNSAAPYKGKNGKYKSKKERGAPQGQALRGPLRVAQGKQGERELRWGRASIQFFLRVR